MDLPQLNEEQLQQVQEFFASDTATLLWQRLEANMLADWILAETTEAREASWYAVQAILQLQATLRDATAMKRLDARAQNARTPPGYGTRSQT